MPYILVADDDPAFARSVKDALERDGHNVEVVADGRQAAARIAQGARFDLIVLDLVMPWMDGFEFLEKLGERANSHRPKVLVVTARDDAQAIDRVLSHSVEGYLVKPVDLQVLLDTTRELLRTS